MLKLAIRAMGVHHIIRNACLKRLKVLKKKKKKELPEGKWSGNGSGLAKIPTPVWQRGKPRFDGVDRPAGRAWAGAEPAPLLLPSGQESACPGSDGGESCRCRQCSLVSDAPSFPAHTPVLLLTKPHLTEGSELRV